MSAATADREIAEQLEVWMVLIDPSLEQLRIVPAILDLEWPRGRDHAGSLKTAASTVSAKRIQSACSDRSSAA